MLKSDRTVFRAFRKGCRPYYLAAFLFINALMAGSGHAAESVWGCLLYASNDGQKTDIPVRLSRYEQRLNTAFGYSKLHLLGEGQTTVKSPDQNWLVFGGDIKIQFTSLQKNEEGQFLVGLEIFQGNKQVIETQARVGRDSPLFIRGPEWRNGKIIIVVMIAS
jgi:hypothetical protein